MKIYFSPANHHKPYADGKNTEKPICEKITKKIIEVLSAYEVECFYPTVFNSNQMYTGRPAEAKKLGADWYIPIHTNAWNGITAGNQCFYHPKVKGSKELAELVNKNLNKICPIQATLGSPVRDGTLDWYNTKYEMGEAYNLGMSCIFPETNFHDYLPTAKWLVENIDAIGQAYAQTFVEFFGLKKKPSAKPEPLPTPTTPFPDVPTDAWYAQMIAELKAAGIVNGYPDGTVKPEAEAKRSEMFTVAAKLLGKIEELEDLIKSEKLKK